MRTAEQLLVQYAAYHRDRRNIATHFVGVPVIVFSVVLALAQISLGAVHLAWVGIALASAWYIYLDRTLGVWMLAFLALCGAVASIISAKTGVGLALVIALALFVVGWIAQFIGHKYEGMKPAFVDDLIGLLVGPLFVTSEVLFILGMKRELQQAIEARVGPTMAARDGKPIGPASSMHA
ncbi:MAG: DUF962 domain-containing protein [Burkholderiales bacterium]|jgi:uncharacterized membrane protein YGL010W|nr:DUF962 domain-containing protein [Nitrosomonadaceae bacterium]